MSYRIFLIFILTFLASGIFAQSFSMRKYTVLDGLPQNQIMGMIQDSRGYFWIWTKNGISRFDGIDFVNYNKSDGLPDNLVFRIQEDSKGRIWVLSRHGVSEYTGHGFKYYPPPQDSIYNRFISVLHPDRMGGLWLASTYNFDQNRIIYFKDGNYIDYSAKYPALDTFDFRTYVYIINSDEFILDNRPNGIFSWKNNQLKHWENSGDYRVRTRGARTVVSNRERGLIYHKGVIDTFRRDNRHYSYFTPPYAYRYRDTIYMLTGQDFYKMHWRYGLLNGTFIDRDSMVWINTEEGLYRVQSHAFLNFTAEDGLAGQIWSVVEDTKGNIWFGSLLRSLQVFNGKELIHFDRYRSIQDVPFFMGSTLLSNGHLMFTQSNGVMLFDGLDFSMVDYVKSQALIVFENPKTGTILVGSTGEGLVVHENGKTTYFEELTEPHLGHVAGIALDHEGYYWLVTSKTVVKFDGRNVIPLDEEKVPIHHGVAVAVDSTGRVWLGGEEGLFHYDQLSGEFPAVLPEELNKTVYSINVYDSAHLIAGRVTDVMIINLVKWKNGDPDFYRVYDRTDGYLGIESGQNGIIRDSRGRLWAISSDRVTCIHPERIRTNPLPPVTAITKVEVQSEHLEWKTDTSLNLYYSPSSAQLRLKKPLNNLRIHFTGISTSNPEKVRYSFRLRGFQDEWTLETGERQSTYMYLPPGNYSFELKAKNSDGVWTDNTISLPVTIVPTFFQTGLFLILIILLGAVIVGFSVFAIMKSRQRMKEKQDALLREYSRLQMSTIMRQFDPHFTFNVIASVGSLILKGDKNTAYQYFVKLSNLLRAALKEHDQLVKPVSQELDFVRDYCDIQKLRFKDRFDYSIEIPESLDEQQPVPKMIIQNFVENAIKHGIEHKPEGGKVEVLLEPLNEGIQIKIRDNGIGREAAAGKRTAGTGKGQEITGRIFNLMNERNPEKIEYSVKDLVDEDMKPAGTEVRILIPEGYQYNVS